jgi:uncharacterized protein GlcG (DUF336 family)
MHITLDTARDMIRAGMGEAQRIGNACSIAIVDENGWLVAAERMEDALVPTLDIARDKAWTAFAFKMPSSEIGRFGNPSAANAGFNTANWNDRLTTIGGGVPIKAGNSVIGGVGVSGGTEKEDVAVCQTAIKAIATPRPA